MSLNDHEDPLDPNIVMIVSFQKHDRKLLAARVFDVRPGRTPGPGRSPRSRTAARHSAPSFAIVAWLTGEPDPAGAGYASVAQIVTPLRQRRAAAPLSAVSAAVNWHGE